MDFGIEIDGDRAVALRFAQFPERARAALQHRLEAISQQLLARVQGAEPARTGRLKGETVPFASSSGDRVRGGVHVAAPDSGEHGKGAALEYGAHGSAQVTAHARALDHVFGRRLTSPLAVMVAAYSRHVNIAERRYLRGPLDAMRGEIVAELRAALDEAAAE
jgi:hypothetical protein